MHVASDKAFVILMYHRITPRTEGLAAPTWNVPPERFHRQLSGLLSRGYRAWPLSRALACRESGEPIPSRTFVVTFDDGYENLYYHAWPILKSLRVPATVFVATGYLDADRPFPFDDWEAKACATVPVVSWKPLTRQHCAEMLDEGLIEIGSHTHSHADFHGQPEAFRADVERSLEVLREFFGIVRASFAFPFGYFSREMVEVSRAVGLKCALTAEPRLVLPNADPFSWGRFTVTDRDTACSLSLKFNCWYSAMRCVWHWLRRPWRTNSAWRERRDEFSCSRVGGDALLKKNAFP